MIFLFTDFSSADIYAGQVRAVFARRIPDVPVIDLLHDVPNFQIRAAAHLLSALVSRLPAENVFMAVVDPGVGSTRQPVVLEAGGSYFVGPDNGLLSIVAARAAQRRCWRIDWRPDGLSHSFHGRDLFAPVAAAIASGAFPHDKLTGIEQFEVQLDAADLAEVIYVDHYGNAMTGLRAGNVPHAAKLSVNAQVLYYARTFSEVPVGTAFWYENCVGLVEIAVNCGSAAQQLGLLVGQGIARTS